MNQQIVASSCADKDTLDLCCFIGSFSFNTKSAADIDSNDDATSSENDNAIANSLHDICAFAQADIEDHMKKCIEEQKHFDVTTLDPPKLAPTLSSFFCTKPSALSFSMEYLCNNQKNILHFFNYYKYCIQCTHAS